MELVRPLYRFGIRYGSQIKYKGTSIFNVHNDLNKTKSIYAGNAGNGKRYFFFSTEGSWGAGYAALKGSANIYNFS